MDASRGVSTCVWCNNRFVFISRSTNKEEYVPLSKDGWFPNYLDQQDRYQKSSNPGYPGYPRHQDDSFSSYKGLNTGYLAEISNPSSRYPSQQIRYTEIDQPRYQEISSSIYPEARYQEETYNEYPSYPDEQARYPKTSNYNPSYLVQQNEIASQNEIPNRVDNYEAESPEYFDDIYTTDQLPNYEIDTSDMIEIPTPKNEISLTSLPSYQLGTYTSSLLSKFQQPPRFEISSYPEKMSSYPETTRYPENMSNYQSEVSRYPEETSSYPEMSSYPETYRYPDEISSHQGETASTNNYPVYVPKVKF